MTPAHGAVRRAPSLRDIALAAALYGLGLAALAFLAFIGAILGLFRAVDGGAISALLVAANAGLMTGAAWFGVRRPAGERREVLGLFALPPRWTIRSIAFGVLLLVLVAIATAVLRFFFHEWIELPGAREYGLDKASPARFAFVLLAGAYLAPLGEELVFRGLLFGWLYRKAGFATAAVLSSVAFGAVHLGGTPYQAVAAAFYGIALCRLYVAAGSLWAPVFAHRTVNAVGLTTLWLAGWSL